MCTPHVCLSVHVCLSAVISLPHVSENVWVYVFCAFVSVCLPYFPACAYEAERVCGFTYICQCVHLFSSETGWMQHSARSFQCQGHPQWMWASCKQTLASPLYLDINSCQEIALHLCGECEILNVRREENCFLWMQEQSFGEDARHGTAHHSSHTSVLRTLQKCLFGEIENGDVLALSTPLLIIWHHKCPLHTILCCTNKSFYINASNDYM